MTSWLQQFFFKIRNLLNDFFPLINSEMLLILQI